ncbi:MAG: hypothetical protein MRY79_08480 [Alphaproteobacteria bacterium]|nr:hypothetical protein [Alphaproteobacteria bacterium]
MYHQSGNILIYIMGAIFLLGILVVMMKGSSTPGSNIDQEQLMIRVAEVQEYGQELERAVTYILRNGYSESDIRFAHPNAPSSYGVITDDPERQVFHRSGGGATYRAPPSGIQTTATDWLFTGRNNAAGIGVDAATTGETRGADLIAFLQNVSQDFCILINEKNDINNPSDAPPQDTDDLFLSDLFTGSYAFQESVDAPETEGKLEGCLEGAGTPPAGTYHYYRVLLAR